MLSNLRKNVKAARRELSLRRLPTIAPFPPAQLRKPVSHAAAFQLANAGDVLLPLTLKDVIHTDCGELNWNNLHVHNEVSDRTVRSINESAGLIIGGGGLFLRDTNPNQLSGWQWSCSLEHLRQIEVPIAAFAVGYNRFRGQPDFEPIFTEHVNELAKRSVYLGLRNQGSINAMRAYLTPENQEKLRFQPCMTTVLSRIYPRLCDYENKEDFIALNAAFDRPELRFGSDPPSKLRELANAIRRLGENRKLKYYAHMERDEQMCPYLDAAGVEYELVRLDRYSPERIVAEYAKPSLVIGMRGHAQMIPFGTETPILSLITHDKLRFFIDDIGHPEWGVDMGDDGFAEDLVALSEEILDSRTETQAMIRESAEVLWDTCRTNVRDFLHAIEA
ncbi:MAG: polysaccharide pyruvyl transferase WcaK-like protein [Bradymonadia bacterium]|jgi:polysaccharide pyruvyl transferase WcaK-like protein